MKIDGQYRLTRSCNFVSGVETLVCDSLKIEISLSTRIYMMHGFILTFSYVLI